MELWYRHEGSILARGQVDKVNSKPRNINSQSFNEAIACAVEFGDVDHITEDFYDPEDFYEEDSVVPCVISESSTGTLNDNKRRSQPSVEDEGAKRFKSTHPAGADACRHSERGTYQLETNTESSSSEQEPCFTNTFFCEHGCFPTAHGCNGCIFEARERVGAGISNRYDVGTVFGGRMAVVWTNSANQKRVDVIQTGLFSWVCHTLEACYPDDRLTLQALAFNTNLFWSAVHLYSQTGSSGSSRIDALLSNPLTQSLKM